MKLSLKNIIVVFALAFIGNWIYEMASDWKYTIAFMFGALAYSVVNK